MKHVYSALRKLKFSQRKYTEKGLTGPHWLMFLENVDMVAEMGVDYMQGVLLGIQKLLLTL